MTFKAAITAATPAPKIFTLPVAMVFRQLIARALFAGEGGAAIGGVNTVHRATALTPFPATELYEFPRVLADALPSPTGAARVPVDWQ